MSLLTTTFTEPRERGRAFGIFGAIGASGGSIGLLLGGTLTELIDWRATMYVNLVFATLAVTGTFVLATPQRSGCYTGVFVLGAILALAMFRVPPDRSATPPSPAFAR